METKGGVFDAWRPGFVHLLELQGYSVERSNDLRALRGRAAHGAPIQLSAGIAQKEEGNGG